jgi:hypothetical protein
MENGSSKPLSFAECFKASEVRKSCIIFKSRPRLSSSEDAKIASMIVEERSMVINVG